MFFCITFLIFFNIFKLLHLNNLNKKLETDNHDSKLNIFLKSKKGYFSFDRIRNFLISRGNPLNLSPISYLVIKFLLTILLFSIFISKNPTPLSILIQSLFTVLGFFLIDICYTISNISDSKEIRYDLPYAYDTLCLQNTAGVFIGNALKDLYMIVKNKRLKKALTELSAEIIFTNNIDKALDNFSLKFHSSYIDTFVMTIKQILLTGKAQDILEDISDGIKYENLTDSKKITNKIENHISLTEFLLYFGFTIIVIFSLIVLIKANIKNILI